LTASNVDSVPVSLPTGDPGTSPTMRAPYIFGVPFLLARGLLLWLVVPVTLALWLVGVWHWRRRGVHLGELLGWADLNLIAGLQRSVLRPVVRQPLGWITLGGATGVTHRIGIADPV